MKKAAARRETTTVAQDDIERSLLAFAARRQFVGTSVNMGWQLALTVLVPVFIGIKLDGHFHSSPSYTLAALMVAATGAVIVVAHTVRQVNAESKKENTTK